MSNKMTSLESKKKIILIGFGGHASSCVDLIENSNKFEIIGFIGKNNEKNKIKYGYKVIGTDKELKEIFKTTNNAAICLGQIRDYKKRSNYFDNLKKIGFEIPTIVSKNSYISKKAIINEGSMIFHGSIINAGAKIGRNCIINSRSLIEHDVTIGENCHISTGTIINGNCKIGKSTFIGSGSVIKNDIKISAKSFIEMQSRIINDQ